MNFLTIWLESLENLLADKLHSFLAILGILVGTGSVVALIYCGQLATTNALSQFKTLGTNILAINVYQQRDAHSKPTKGTPQQLTLQMMPQLKASSPQISEVAPYTSTYQSYYIHGISGDGQIMGATHNLADVAKINVAQGRFVSLLDKHLKYCVIGSTLAQKIKAKGINPLYQSIMIGKYFFTIIGVLKPWTASFFFYADLNNGIVIPIGSSYYLSRQVTINSVLVRLIKHPHIMKAQAKIHSFLHQLLPNMQINFQNPQKIIEVVSKQKETFSLLLTAIGSISLIVGGIGVMNIMLLSVMQRRREIGIRMAIGAKRLDVMRMFLIESILLSSLGGLLGMLLGLLAAVLVAHISHWQFHFILWPIGIGLIVSVLVGVISGFYPAWRASRLDPIVCLRMD